ncbi:MAG: histidine kinase [Haloferacaceae archaeon]
MPLESFLDRVDAPTRTLVVANRSGPEPIQSMLVSTFADQPVEVDERDLPEVGDDRVLLVEDEEVIATSPLSAIEDTILLVNSDLYRTGTRGIETLDVPDVIEHLGGVRFSLRGYPKSDREKLLLIVISRYIEQRAWQAGRGCHRASFQYLSRIRDERGTRRVYESLAGTDLDVHVYGVPDWLPPEDFAPTAHVGDSHDFRHSWFVLFRPPGTDGERGASPDGSAAPADTDARGPVALLAVEREPREWEGFWTFDPSLVADLDAYIRREL